MNSNDSVYVWDIAVRIFHWSLVVAFTVAYVSGEGNEDLHVAAGYAVLGLILFRIVWGFIGTRHARFADFIYRPSQIMAYVGSVMGGRPRYYEGHNPAGGVMVILLLLGLLGISWTGLKLEAAEGHGPLAAGHAIVSVAYAEEEGERGAERGGRNAAEEYWEDLHEAIANATLALVFIHILAVILSSLLHKENLVRAMVTGRKPKREGRG